VRSRRAAIALSVTALVVSLALLTGPPAMAHSGPRLVNAHLTSFGKVRAIVRLKRFLHDVRKREHVASLHGYRKLSAMRSRRGSAAQKAVLARDRARKRRLDAYLAHKRHRLRRHRHRRARATLAAQRQANEEYIDFLRSKELYRVTQWMQLISHQLDRLYIDLHRRGGIPGRS
jgi:hypothetical protein